MAVSHKDRELPNSQIWLGKINIDRGPDSRLVSVYVEKVAN